MHSLWKQSTSIAHNCSAAAVSKLRTPPDLHVQALKDIKKKTWHTTWSNDAAVCPCSQGADRVFIVHHVSKPVFWDYIWKWQTRWLILAGGRGLPPHILATAANVHPAPNVCFSCAFQADDKYECAACQCACSPSAASLAVFTHGDVEGKQWDNTRNPQNPCVAALRLPTTKRSDAAKKVWHFLSCQIQFSYTEFMYIYSQCLEIQLLVIGHWAQMCCCGWREIFVYLIPADRQKKDKTTYSDHKTSQNLRRHYVCLSSDSLRVTAFISMQRFAHAMKVQQQKGTHIYFSWRKITMWPVWPLIQSTVDAVLQPLCGGFDSLE